LGHSLAISCRCFVWTRQADPRASGKFGLGRFGRIVASSTQCLQWQKDETTRYPRSNQQIKRRGGKFVKQVDGVWVDVDEKTAREKVSHTFRMRNKKQDALEKFPRPKRELEVPQSERENIDCFAKKYAFS
jgi:hypothetical protein